MNLKEINELIRDCVISLEEHGLKSTICKIMHGDSTNNSFSSIVNEDITTRRKLGISSLTRIAGRLDHEVYMVFVDKSDKNDDELIKLLSDRNKKFIKDLSDSIISYLHNNKNSRSRARKIITSSEEELRSKLIEAGIII